MAARLPRRSFATPFVVTLAATSSACFVESSPRPQRAPSPVATTAPTESAPPPTHSVNPPAPAQPDPPPTHTLNPPAPTPPTQTSGSRPPVAPTQPTTTVAEGPAPRKPGGVIANPPRPTPAAQERRWQVTRSHGTCTYQALLTTSTASGCPSGPAGGPVPTCNPPPPRTVACPERTTDGETFQVVQYAGESSCSVVSAPMACPKGVMCNPPPPRRATCPQ